MSKAAVIFPGQGAQQLGMGQSLFERYALVKELYKEASDILGYDLAEVSFKGPEEELTKSDRAQPAIFVHSIAALRVLQQETALQFDAAAGLSSGEWAALQVAGVIPFEEALKILEARGRFMQQACVEQRGGMLSIIGLEQRALEALCAEAGIEIANYNSPGQTVLSGPLEGIEKAQALAKDAGAKRAIPLPVAGAFHSSLMGSAATAFADFIESMHFSEPQIPVLSNASGTLHGADLKEKMVEQITASVRWVDNIQWMIDCGVNHFVECGPGKVLVSLVKRIDNQVALTNIQDGTSLDVYVEASKQQV